jgi:hypothetical protein
MTQQEHLKRIRARCVKLLEIAEKRTPRAWDSGRNWVGSDHACVATTHHYSHESDATFIASCAGAAEAGWKAAIAAIDTVAGLQKVPYGWDGDCGASAYADNLTDSIIASWPAELL